MQEAFQCFVLQKLRGLDHTKRLGPCNKARVPDQTPKVSNCVDNDGLELTWRSGAKAQPSFCAMACNKVAWCSTW